MKQLSSIAPHLRQLPFTVPAGYFESLQERVMQRCVEPVAAPQEQPSTWHVVRSQLAFAAGFAALVGVAALLARLIVPDGTAETALAAYVSPLDIELAYEEYAAAPNGETDDEAIVDYLLHTGNAGFLAMY